MKRRNIILLSLISILMILLTGAVQAKEWVEAVQQTMGLARAVHTATLLDDGPVLLTGGSDGNAILARAEIFDPAAGTFSAAGAMSIVRYKHGAIRLLDGRVLIVGGSDERDRAGRYRSLEIFDPATGEFSPAGHLLHKRFKLADSLALMPSGNVVIGGGGRSVEIYMPSEKASFGSYENLDEELFFTAATPLADGSVLITGGYDFNIEATNHAWRVLFHQE